MFHLSTNRRPTSSVSVEQKIGTNNAPKCSASAKLVCAPAMVTTQNRFPAANSQVELKDCLGSPTVLRSSPVYGSRISAVVGSEGVIGRNRSMQSQWTPEDVDPDVIPNQFGKLLG